MDLGRRAKRVLVQLVRALHIRVGRLADRLDASSRLADESVAEPGIEDEAQRAPGAGRGAGGPPAHWVNLVRRHAPQLLRPASTGQPLPATTAPPTRARHLPATAIAVGNQPQGAADDSRPAPQRALPERRTVAPVRQPDSTQGAGTEGRRVLEPVAAGDTTPLCEPVMHREPHRGVPPSVPPVPGLGVRRPLSASQTSAPRTTLTATATLQPNRPEPDHRTPKDRPRAQAGTAALPTGPMALRDPNDGLEHLQRRPVPHWPESALPSGARSVPNIGAPAAPPDGLSRTPHRGAGSLMCTESQASLGHSGNAGTAQVPQPPAARAPLASAGPFLQPVEPSARSWTRACEAASPAANKVPPVQRTASFAGDADRRPTFSEPLWPRLADELDLAAEPGGKPSPWPSLPDEAAGQEGLSRSETLRATQQQERVMQRKRTLDIEQRGGFWNV
jgi:hypothetical protein